MPDLIVTRDECLHLALTIRVEDAERGTGPPPLLRWIGAALEDPGATFMVRCSVAELWFLDTHLKEHDPRSTKLPSGLPVLTLLEKVWVALVEAHRKEWQDAADEDRRPDPDDDVAGRAPLHGPGRGPAARRDLPAAEAGAGLGGGLA